MRTETFGGISRRTAIKFGAAATGALLALNLLAGHSARKVVVWSEGTAKVDPQSKKVYPQDINTAIVEGLSPLKEAGWQVRKSGLNDPERRTSDDLLKNTAVLI